MISDMLNISLYRAWAEIKAESQRSYAGILWWLIRPLLSLAVYGIVFGLIFKNTMPNFLLFLFSGIIAWEWFACSVLRSANSINANRNLMLLVKVDPAMFPLSVNFVDTVKFLLGFSILFIAVIIQVGVNINMLYLPLIMGGEFLFCVGVGFIFAAITPFVPDCMMILTTVMQLLMFLSGVFYRIDTLPAAIQKYIVVNPMASVLNQYRLVLLDKAQPDLGAIFYIYVFAGILTVIGYAMTKHFSCIYAKRW